MTPKEKALILPDAASSSERTVSRRSLLGIIGIGAAAFFAPARPAGAAFIKRNTGDSAVVSPATEPKKDSKKEKSLKAKPPKGSTSKP